MSDHLSHEAMIKTHAQDYKDALAQAYQRGRFLLLEHVGQQCDRASLGTTHAIQRLIQCIEVEFADRGSPSTVGVCLAYD